MNTRTHRKAESGQALVLLVIALLGVIGFAGLAIDGGQLYTEQRRAQAAADNAAMAAAYLRMKGETDFSDLRAAAFANALENGYDDNVDQTDIQFHYPPISGPYAGDDAYVEVIITQRVSTALAHLVYGQSPIPVTVNAVAHGLPAAPLMAGYAIAAMKPGCDGPSTITIEGNGGGSAGGTWLYDGGAFSNSSCNPAITMNGGDSMYTNGPPIDAVGPAVWGNNCTEQPITDDDCNFWPAPNTGVPEQVQDPLVGYPAANPPAHLCGASKNFAAEVADGVITPGTYTTMDAGNQSFSMEPGVYCLVGGILSSKQAVTGQNVLIYMVDTPSRIDFSGNGSITLSAPTLESTGCQANPNQDICDYLNILVYKRTGSNICGNSSKEIDFTGNGSKNVTGLVYAPYSLVRYNGNGSLVMTGQTIAGCVEFSGNGYINIVYDPDLTYNPPPHIRLDE